MALIGAIQGFNNKTDNWVLYQEQLEQFFAINDIRDNDTGSRRVAALLSLIGQNTYKVLRDICTPILPKEKKYEELCELLKKHFSPATSIYRERIQFYEARQEEDESVKSWYARIHNLSGNCEFGVGLNIVLKDKFVCGLRKGPIRDRLCEEEIGVSLEKLLQIASSKEMTISENRGEVNIVNKRKGRSGWSSSSLASKEGRGIIIISEFPAGKFIERLRSS